jgi:uncharacterized protein (DUF1684 family)
MSEGHDHEQGHDHDHEHDHRHEHSHQHHEHRAMSYREAVESFRADKDEYFGSNPHSPIPATERAAFSGLPYYPVDESLRFDDLTLEPYTGNEPSDFQIPTSDGKLRPAHRAGYLTFEVDGASNRLTAYTFDGGDGQSLFVPFLDKTSGVETYGAGRYLDLEPEDDGTYALDFRLPIPIEAGERLAQSASFADQ